LDDEQLAEAYPFEDWVLAKSAVGMPGPDEVETDLFAGITDVLARPKGLNRPGRLISPGPVSSPEASVR
ncbi:MAG: hypothetical protein ACKOYO_03865, partial [Actinomycetota bacterium]